MKWHATLINTRFRKEDEAAEKERQEQAAGDATAGGRGGGGRGGGRGGRGGAPFGRAGGAERVPFDARRILRVRAAGGPPAFHALWCSSPLPAASGAAFERSY